MSIANHLKIKKARRCPHCDKVYVSVPAFSMHVRTHSQGCKCPYCGKSFSRPWLLQGHIRTHTGIILLLRSLVHYASFIIVHQSCCLFYQVRSRSAAKYATRRSLINPTYVPTSRRIPTWSRLRAKDAERPLHSNPTFTNTRRAPAWKCRPLPHRWTTALIRHRRSKPKTIHSSRLSNHCISFSSQISWILISRLPSIFYLFFFVY